jgi:hypothetical protein
MKNLKILNLFNNNLLAAERYCAPGQARGVHCAIVEAMRS